MTCMNTTRTDLGIEPDYYFTAGHYHVRASELHVHYMPDKDEARNYQHRHRDCEFQFVDNGSCVYYADGKHYTLSAGEFMLIAPGVFHSQKSASPRQFNKFCFCFRLDFDDSISKAERDAAEEALRVPITIRPLPSLLPLVSLIREEAARFDTLTHSSVCSMLSLLFAQVLRAVLPAVSLTAVPDNLSLHDRRSDVIDAYFSGEFCHRVSQDALAKRLGVSRRQLARIIQSIYGKSFREKLVEARLEIAVDFLVNTGWSVEEISSRLAYENIANFSAFFKRNTGLTPSQFRKQYQTSKPA